MSASGESGVEGAWAIDFTNTQIVTMRRHESAFREATSSFDLFVPDGMPLIWVLNRRGAELTDRVYGPTFMRRCMAGSPALFTHYLLGGSEECLAQLLQRLLAEQPRAMDHERVLERQLGGPGR